MRADQRVTGDGFDIVGDCGGLGVRSSAGHLGVRGDLARSVPSRPTAEPAHRAGKRRPPSVAAGKWRLTSTHAYKLSPRRLGSSKEKACTDAEQHVLAQPSTRWRML